jgi:hypothetical protein
MENIREGVNPEAPDSPSQDEGKGDEGKPPDE